jgi:glucan phosphoethanolaminetransferase (alkaline phosphatase superfamily)
MHGALLAQCKRRIWRGDPKVSRPLAAARLGFSLIFAVLALAVPGICALWVTPDFAQAAATVWITLATIAIALYLYRFRIPRVLLHLMLLAVPIAVFYRLLYRGSISPGVMLSIQATTLRETAELLSNHLTLTLVLGFFVTLAVVALITAWTTEARVSTRALARLCVTAGLLACVWGAAVFHKHGELHNMDWALKDSAREVFPLDVLLSSKIVALGVIRTARSRSARTHFTFQDVRSVDASGTEKPQVYVVVIGESSRRSHWSLYGYNRVTTPTLDQMRNQLVVFDDVSSNATITMYSVTLALTRASPSSWELARHEKSLLTLLREGGYSVAWISNQEKFGFSENPVTSIAGEANSVSFANDYVNDLSYKGPRDPFDTNLLARLDRELDRLRASKQRAVIFLHMMGSHEAYDQRYPPAFDIFRPDSQPRTGLNAQQSRIIDTYDNSIRFTDYVLSSVIQRIAALNEPAAVVYFSDHGERLFESDEPTLSGHGFPQQSVAELEVPLLLWLSPVYLQDNPEALALLQINAHKATSLDSVFETVVDLTRLSYADRDTSASLLSPNLRAQKTTEVLTMSQTPICVAAEPSRMMAGAGALLPVPCEH